MDASESGDHVDRPAHTLEPRTKVRRILTPVVLGTALMGCHDYLSSAYSNPCNVYSNSSSRDTQGSAPFENDVFNRVPSTSGSYMVDEIVKKCEQGPSRVAQDVFVYNRNISDPTRHPPPRLSDKIAGKFNDGDDNECDSSIRDVASKQWSAVECGKQVKFGVKSRMVPEGLSMSEHLERSTNVTHPVDRESTVPFPIREVIHRNAKVPTGELIRERERLCEWLDDVAHHFQEANNTIIERSDPKIQSLLRKPSGNTNVAAMAYLASVAGHSDVDFPRKFSEGFPLTGVIEPSGLWKPVDLEDAYSQRISVEDLERHRAEINEEVEKRTRPNEHSDKLWKSTMADINDGWADGPFLTEEAVSEFLETREWYKVPRFPHLDLRPKFREDSEGHREFVLEEKCRAIDDGKASGVNRATILLEKMVNADVDQISATVRLLREIYGDGVNLMGAAADLKSAYRVVPTNPQHRRYCVTTLHSPVHNQPVFVVLRGHSFGNSASVHNFGRLSQLISTILRNICKIPVNHYVDDFWALEASSTLPSALKVLNKVFEVLGFTATTDKEQMGEKITLLGVRFDLNGTPPNVSITEAKKEHRIADIEKIEHSRVLGSGKAGKIRGALQYLLSHLFASRAKGFLQPLIERQYRQGPQNQNDDWNKDLTWACKGLKEIVKAAPPRPILPREPRGSHIVLYTDGMQKGKSLLDAQMGIGGVLVDQTKGVREWWHGEVPVKIRKDMWAPIEAEDEKSTYIALVELYAAYQSLKVWGDNVRGRRVIWFVDNDATHAMAVKATSRQNDARGLVQAVWGLIERLGVVIWIERVESKANISDVPSRFLVSSKDTIEEYRQYLAAQCLREKKVKKMYSY